LRPFGEGDALVAVAPLALIRRKGARFCRRIDLFPGGFLGHVRQRSVEAQCAIRALARRLFTRTACGTTLRRTGAAS
jgi:hypothetical protein